MNCPLVIKAEACTVVNIPLINACMYCHSFDDIVAEVSGSAMWSWGRPDTLPWGSYLSDHRDRGKVNPPHIRAPSSKKEVYRGDNVPVATPYSRVSLLHEESYSTITKRQACINRGMMTAGNRGAFLRDRECFASVGALM